MSRDNDSITFPVAHLLAIFNVAWSLVDRETIGDLSAPVTPAQMAFAPGLLTAQALVQTPPAALFA